MFGYVTLNAEALDEQRRARYQAYYCGLCRALKARYGNLGRLTLSNDMTFLYLLLCSLYEPDEEERAGRCLPHPFKPRAYVRNEAADYCADMNIALAYHKCLDNWTDERSLSGRAEAALLREGYRRAERRWPDKCRAIETSLAEIARLEREAPPAPDAPANQTARMLGELFAWKDDFWADELRAMGGALGRFIYVMDAYDDLEGDLRRGRYNPLAAWRERPDFEELCKDGLTLHMAECARAFETLPLERDADILRNILYSGVWAAYQRKRSRAERKNGALVKEKEND